MSPLGVICREEKDICESWFFPKTVRRADCLAYLNKQRKAISIANVSLKYDFSMNEGVMIQWLGIYWVPLFHGVLVCF